MDGAAKPKPKSSWAFMVEHMPKCVQLIREERAKGGEHLDKCWRRGVVELQPGWFWAYEAGVSVGVPDIEMLSDPNMQELLRTCGTVAVLKLRDPVAPEQARAQQVNEGGGVPPAQRGARPKNAA